MNKDKAIIENCGSIFRLFNNHVVPCYFCQIKKICVNNNRYNCNIYREELKKEEINNWGKEDRDMAFELIAKYPIKLHLEKVDIQNLQEGDLSLFSESEVIKCLKELDSKCEKLQEEIDYEYELSLGWDI